MPRLTSSVFRDLAIWMAGFGLLIGLVFPPFALLLGVPAAKAITSTFYLACLSAGALVGGVSWGLARLVVGRRLALLADRMTVVARAVSEATYTGDWLDCQADRCRVAVDSEDEIGRSARSFNALVDALSHSHDVEAAVDRFAQTLAAELELDALIPAAFGQLMELSEACAGAVVLVADGDVAVRLAEGIAEPAALAADEHVRRALRTGGIELVNDRDGVLAAASPDCRPQQVQYVPVAFKSEVLAVLVLASEVGFRPETRRLVELLRPTFGLALNSALVHERLQRLAALDPLTDLYNRRFGLARLREEFSRATRAGSALGVVMLDVDRFKRTNDRYGHVVGDRALRSVARACRRVLREGDVLVRYGGDEFLAIVPGATRAEAADVGERMRREVCATVAAEGEGIAVVTVSIGVSSNPEDAAETEIALLERADAALYEAKQLGRDRVVSSGPQPEPLAEVSGRSA